MLSNTRRAIQIMWRMLYQGDMLSFLNLEPKFLDLKTYLNFIKKIRIFAPTFAKCQHRAQGGFYVYEGYLFIEGKLCIPQGTHRKLLIKELHEGGLMG